MNHLSIAVVSFAIIAASTPKADIKEKDYSDVPLKQIGVTLVQAAKDAKTGFLVGGKNSTDLIRKLTEINGRKIADLENDMRPGATPSPDAQRLEPWFDGSGQGFLGKNEKLLDVLAMDNDFVVELGRTHQDMARPFLIAAALGRSSGDKTTSFRYHGQDYRITMICYKGAQFSPFLDKTSASCEAELENVTANKKLKYSLLVPMMIERYGFYEGKGTPYRVEPATIVELFPFLKKKAKTN